MRLRVDAPLLDGYLSYLESDATPFITPGHKGRASKLDADLGAVVAGDVPLYGGVDTVKSARGLLAEAERRSARWYGATGAVTRREAPHTAIRRSASRSDSRATRSS